MVCHSCGKEVNSEWAFCPSCGNAIYNGKDREDLRTMQFDDGEIISYDENKAHDFLRNGDASRQVMTCSINREGQVANHKFIRRQSNSYVVVLTINDPQCDFDDLITKDCLDAEKAEAFLDEEMSNKSELHEMYNSIEWVLLGPSGGGASMFQHDQTIVEDQVLTLSCDLQSPQCEDNWSMRFDDGEDVPYDKKKVCEFLQDGNVPRRTMSCSIDRGGQITRLQFFRTRFCTYFVVLVLDDPKSDSNVLIANDSLEVETAIDLLAEEIGDKSGAHRLRDSLEWISLDDKKNHFGLGLEDYTAYDDYQKER